mmetsp:Transcript_38449/g.96519  ORF Transcript_38449/g.96519 Transcript_38449/m.96519 type:complete len:145 (-) Transcript_38449:73-507(-)
MQRAVGSAFHGSTSKERLTFEKPALREDNGIIAAVPAAAYGRKRQLEIGLVCAGANGERSLASLCAAATTTLGSGFHARNMVIVRQGMALWRPNRVPKLGGAAKCTEPTVPDTFDLKGAMHFWKDERNAIAALLDADTQVPACR